MVKIFVLHFPKNGLLDCLLLRDFRILLPRFFKARLPREIYISLAPKISKGISIAKVSSYMERNQAKQIKKIAEFLLIQNTPAAHRVFIRSMFKLGSSLLNTRRIRPKADKMLRWL